MPKLIIFAILIVLILGAGFYFLEVKDKEIMTKEIKEPKAKSQDVSVRKEKIDKKPQEKISIITIFDNYQSNLELETGWGFSCLIKTPEEDILFDTGADSKTLLSNMKKMEIEPGRIDKIVLSHIHSDHIGGLEGALKKNPEVIVYIPSSFPYRMRKKINSLGAKHQDIKTNQEISENIYSTGELGTWIKEQSLILDTEKGLTIITGCAHPGIVEIIKKAKEMFPDKKIYLVMGGFHLSGVSDSELERIVREFRNLDVQKAAPCHCSGDRCRELFLEEYQDDFIKNGVGKIIEI